MRPHLLALLLGLALIAGACGTSAADPVTPDPEPTVEPDDPDYDADWPPMVADWNGDFTIELPNGWTVRPCEGDAPLLCFSDGDRHVGAVEIGDYPVADDFDGDVRSYLYAHAEDFLEGMREDRAIGCPHLMFEPVPVIDFTIDGERGVKTGFRLVDEDGVERERHVMYWAIRGGTQYVITAGAYDDEQGCIERIGEFLPHDLGLVTLYLDRIVEQTPLPAPTTSPAGGDLADGTHIGRVVAMEGGSAPTLAIDPVEMLTGAEAIAAAREDGEIGPDDELPNDVYIRNLSEMTHSTPVSSTAVVAVYDCTQACEHVGVDLADFLAGRVRAMNGAYAIFTFTISGGAVTEITEIYLP